MKEFFARLNPMERRFVVGVGVAFFLVANMVWVWPRFSDWAATRAANTDAQRKVALFQGGIDQIPALTTAISKYQHQGQVVPQEEQAVQFLRTILNQATASGVTVINQGSGRQSLNTNNPYFVEQNQTIQTVSGEKQMVDFLYNLGAGSNSLIRVKNLSIQPDPPRQALSARITLVASYQKKLPTAGAAAPKGAAPATPKTTAPAAAPKPATPKPANPAASGAPAPGAAPRPTPPNPAAAPRPFPVPMNHGATNKPNPLTPNKK
jgi:hypothetical protein